MNYLKHITHLLLALAFIMPATAAHAGTSIATVSNFAVNVANASGQVDPSALSPAPITSTYNISVTGTGNPVSNTQTYTGSLAPGATVTITSKIYVSATTYGSTDSAYSKVAIVLNGSLDAYQAQPLATNHRTTDSQTHLSSLSWTNTSTSWATVSFSVTVQSSSAP